MSGIVLLELGRLRTDLAPLRGPRTDPDGSLSPLPIRVAPAADGIFPVLDGFKRWARWRAEGRASGPSA